MTASPVPTTLFASIDGGKIAYDDTGGEGAVVLCIPGMGDLRSEYRKVRPLLEQAGYRVVTMDIRGHGETSVSWPDYSAHAVGRDALALLDHLGAGPAVVLGNSFAAGSALWMAHDAPVRISGIVLLGPIVRDIQVSAVLKQVMRVAFAGPWNMWFWTTYWNSLFPLKKPDDHAEAKAALASNLRQPGRMQALKTMGFLSKADTAAIISKIEVPSLIVMGSKDPDFPDAEVEASWLTAQLDGELLMVKGSGHYPHTEVPDDVAPTLLAFIAGCRPLPETPIE